VSWATLLERADATTDAAVDDVTRALARRRDLPDDETGPVEGDPAPDDAETTDSSGSSPEGTGSTHAGTGGTAGPADPEPEPSPARVVADADVLAADLLVGGDARDALDGVRAHSWTTLVASDPLLADAAAVVTVLGGPELAADWRARADRLCERVDHPPGDHPALASAYRGGAMHVLSFDDRLRSAGTGAAIREHVETSVKHPGAFAHLFDPASLYAAVEDSPYPGPDRDPRA
jgi:hypothetical protein